MKKKQGEILLKMDTFHHIKKKNKTCPPPPNTSKDIVRQGPKVKGLYILTE